MEITKGQLNSIREFESFNIVKVGWQYNGWKIVENGVEFDTISDFSRIEEITSSWERRG